MIDRYAYDLTENKQEPHFRSICNWYSLYAGNLRRNGVFFGSNNWSGAVPDHYLLHCFHTNDRTRRHLLSITHS